MLQIHRAHCASRYLSHTCSWPALMRPPDDLSPHSTIVDFKDLTIFRVGGQIAAPASALPIGASSMQDPTQMTEVSPAADMTHSIFALSHATSPDKLLEANVAGYLYVCVLQVLSLIHI
eukprot:Mycagemm_TRINITY_DN10055_c0_g1::TRINITY_DN10055_c0_g1_i2::g.2197::m.2197 type:complete len:119 gc:universal TRINITY_DN10055_c0_g1_i2:269-625(+)